MHQRSKTPAQRNNIGFSVLNRFLINPKSRTSGSCCVIIGACLARVSPFGFLFVAAARLVCLRRGCVLAAVFAALRLGCGALGVFSGSFAFVRSSLVLRQSAVCCARSAGGSPLRECRTHSAVAAAFVPLAVVRLFSLRFPLALLGRLWIFVPSAGWFLGFGGIEPPSLVRFVSGVAPIV